MNIYDDAFCYNLEEIKSASLGRVENLRLACVTVKYDDPIFGISPNADIALKENRQKQKKEPNK